MGGDGFCLINLVVIILMEADSERAHRLSALHLHERHNRRRVDTAREKGAQRHVGHHLSPDNCTQQRITRTNDLCFAANQRRAAPTLDDGASGPIAILAAAAIAAREHRQDRPRSHLANALID